MAKKSWQNLTHFVPESYYVLFMSARQISLEKYPYYVRDFDPSLGRDTGFAVFDLVPYMVGGYASASFKIVYKSLVSKSSFERIIYG